MLVRYLAHATGLCQALFGVAPVVTTLGHVMATNRDTGGRRSVAGGGGASVLSGLTVLTSVVK